MNDSPVTADGEAQKDIGTTSIERDTHDMSLSVAQISQQLSDMAGQTKTFLERFHQVELANNTTNTTLRVLMSLGVVAIGVGIWFNKSADNKMNEINREVGELSVAVAQNKNLLSEFESGDVFEAAYLAMRPIETVGEDGESQWCMAVHILVPGRSERLSFSLGVDGPEDYGPLNTLRSYVGDLVPVAPLPVDFISEKPEYFLAEHSFTTTIYDTQLLDATEKSGLTAGPIYKYNLHCAFPYTWDSLAVYIQHEKLLKSICAINKEESEVAAQPTEKRRPVSILRRTK